jgi:hypothetical protein
MSERPANVRTHFDIDWSELSSPSGPNGTTCHLDRFRGMVGLGPLRTITHYIK